MRLFCLIALFLLSAQLNFRAQDATANKLPDLTTLVTRLKDKNHEVAENAADELIKVGTAAILPVTQMLKKEKGCSERILAARVLSNIDPDNEVIKMRS